MKKSFLPSKKRNNSVHLEHFYEVNTQVTKENALDSNN